jgi:hypothetical protein
MATYGGNNGTINADANGDGYSSRRHFNVNAPAFEPRSTVQVCLFQLSLLFNLQPQYIQQTANYSAPYSAYMQQVCCFPLTKMEKIWGMVVNYLQINL